MSVETNEKLPEWNLSDLFAGPESDDLSGALEQAQKLSEQFADAYQGKLVEMDGSAFGQAIRAYEEISEILGKVLSYAQLLFAADVGNSETGRFYQTMQERVNDISLLTLFFQLEINRLDEDTLEGMMQNTEADHYRPWVREVRAFREHQLSDDLEKLLQEKAVSGRYAWIRLFDETQAGMRFSIDGNELGIAGVLNMLSDKDAKERKKAAMTLSEGLGKNLKMFSLIINSLAKDKAIEDNWRKYPRPISERNLSNQVEDDVVDALVGSVQDAYPDLSHRYYRLKAGWFGVEKLDFWDRNAPLPGDDSDRYSWNEARDIVLDAYGAFEPELASIASRFFEKDWIDAAVRDGKDSGAFSHSTVPSVHPYILMNYYGKSRDVMTLAHELGHGVHQMLARKQGVLMADTPLTTAETASVFGEMLIFQSLLKRETDIVRRRILLSGKVEDMLNTVVRQIAFHSFESRLHDERAGGELSAERISDIWMDIQSESLGEGIRLGDAYRSYWSYIPHFIHSPFYVYAYAFGDCLVNSLYDVFSVGHPGFQTKYLDMLSAGGTLRHKELLAPFGLDASDPDFWRRGLKVVSGFIDELEEMETELKGKTS